MTLFWFLFSCTNTESSLLNKLYFVEVSIENFAENSATLPFSATPVEQTLAVRTLDGNGEEFPFTGDLKVHVRPGQLAADQDPWLSIENGSIIDTDKIVRYQAAFGPTRIWLSDEGDKDASSEREPTFATGVTEILNYEFPTISQFNKTTDDNGDALIQNTTNHLVQEFTEIQLENRDVIATVVSTNGFWVTDIESQQQAEDGGYASLYIYTFQKPTGVVPGSRFTRLMGGNQEYLGSTQLSFPAYDIDESAPNPSLIPPPASLTFEQACNTDNRNYDNHQMESFESAVVRLESATITFNSEDEISAYREYGQWPVVFREDASDSLASSCTLYVDSSALSYAFDPTEWTGTDVGPVVGVLNQIWDKWIVVIIDDNGLPSDFEQGASSRNPSLPERPQPRNPPTPIKIPNTDRILHPR